MGLRSLEYLGYSGAGSPIQAENTERITGNFFPRPLPPPTILSLVCHRSYHNYLHELHAWPRKKDTQRLHHIPRPTFNNHDDDIGRNKNSRLYSKQLQLHVK